MGPRLFLAVNGEPFFAKCTLSADKWVLKKVIGIGFESCFQGGHCLKTPLVDTTTHLAEVCPNLLPKGFRPNSTVLPV